MSAETIQTAQPVKLPVRLAAIFYDSILLIALWFTATIPVTLAYGGALHGEWWFRIYLLLIGYLFFGWFWTHGGCTLGMQAWRLRIERDDHVAVGWSTALLRYCTAIVSWSFFGLGFLWSLWDREQRTWHDRLSGSRIVRLPKHKRG